MSGQVLEYHPVADTTDQPILVVDDMPDNCQIVRRRLELRGYPVICATSGPRALDILRQQPVSVVLLDVMMPAMDGYQVLESAAAELGDALPPVIMLTARDAPDEIARAMDLGAVDYVTKPFDFRVLEARIKSQLRRARNAGALRLRTSELEAHLRSLHDRQRQDPLTGLDNVRSFESALSRALATVRSDGNRSHVLCVCVLEEMQAINHTYGPATGDALLRSVAELLRESRQPGDTLARLRGDKFALLFADRSLADVHGNAEGLLRNLANHTVEVDGEMLSVSVSIGLTPIGPKNASVLATIHAAEHASKLARVEGSNHIRVYRGGDEQLEDVRANMRWAMKLKRALREDALALWAQPIVARGRESEAPRRFEILVRMLDDGRPVSPGLFLPAIEKHGLATELDRWVVDHTLDHLAALPAAQQARAERISVNLSGHSLGSRRFRDYVVERMQQDRSITGRICFEITETAAVVHLDHAVDFIRALQELGVSFALDDFGAGVSSFGYLRSLPVDCLKVDGQFVRNLGVSDLDRGIVTAIRQIAQVMGMETVAEFVEDQETIDVLDEIGIDYLQGYFLGRPAPLDTYLCPDDGPAAAPPES